MATPKNITREQFEDTLGRYAKLVRRESNAKKAWDASRKESDATIKELIAKRKELDAKAASRGERVIPRRPMMPIPHTTELLEDETIEGLDKFRFEEAPKKYCQPDPKNQGKRLITPLNAEDLRKLMVWKRHGVHRYRLTGSYVYTEQDFINVSKAAFELYETDSPESEADLPSLSPKDIATLRKLEWVGCGASASVTSLLLSVHDKDNVLHFSDEVYAWLCDGGIAKKRAKTGIAEYKILVTKFRELRDRLGGEVSPMDVEKAAYVLVKEKKAKMTRDREERKAERKWEGNEESKSLKRLMDEAGAFMRQGGDDGGEHDASGGMAEEGEVEGDGGPRRSKRRKT